MFNEMIGSTPFVGNIADSMFPNINLIQQTGYYHDATFMSTIRAILAPRMKPKNEIGVFIRTERPQKDILGKEPKEMLKSILPAFMYDPAEIKNKFLMIDTYVENADKSKALMEKIEGAFPEEFDGFVRHEKISLFYNSFPTVGFINKKLKTTVIFVAGIDHRRYHYLQCSIITALPWYIDPKSLSEDEIALIKSMTLKDGGADEYRKYIKKLASAYDFKSAKIKKELNGFESVCERAARTNAKRKLSEYDMQINDLIARLHSLNKDKRECLIRLSGLESYMSSMPGNDIMEYFLTANNIIYEGVDGTRLTYGVKGYLSMFDRDYAEKVVENKNSVLYEYVDNKDDMQRLYRAIFVDEIVRVRFCAKFRLDITGRVDGISGGTYDDLDYDGCCPNPHIYFHSCMSEHVSVVEERLMAGNYVAAIQQTFASAQTLTLTDHTVVSEFVRFMTDGYELSNSRFIELPGGEAVSPAKAIAWLKEQEA